MKNVRSHSRFAPELNHLVLKGNNGEGDPLLLVFAHESKHQRDMEVIYLSFPRLDFCLPGFVAFSGKEMSIVHCSSVVCSRFTWCSNQIMLAQ